MRLAFFSSIATDGNPRSGYEIANEALVEGLRALGHNVVEFGFRLPRQRQTSDANNRILDTVNLENVLASPLKKFEWIARAHIKRLPIAAAKLTSTSWKSLSTEIAETGPFDGYILNSYQMAAAYPQLLEKSYIYIAHNVEHRSAEENAQSSAQPLERYLYQRDAKHLKKLEKKLCDQAQFVWTFSDLDLADHGVEDDRGCVLPLVAPREVSEFKDIEKKFDLGLIGTWSWQPNLIGLTWFLDNVVPQLPLGITIAIAGSVPAGYSCDSENVTFLGRVDSASQFLHSVSVVPLVSRGGTGVQLKTIETLQAGHACVATSSSLRGINKLPENCIRADTADAFSKAIVECLETSANEMPSGVAAQAFYDDQRRQMLAGLVNGICTLT